MQHDSNMKKVSLSKLHRSEYSAWRNMRTKCYNSYNENYHQFGGKGIKVCERWDKFANFFEDMGKRPEPEFNFARIDNDKNFTPDNCFWADLQTQSFMKSKKNSNDSGYVGVYKVKERWRAVAYHDKRPVVLGLHDCRHEAAAKVEAYKEEHGILPYIKKD